MSEGAGERVAHDVEEHGFHIVYVGDDDDFIHTADASLVERSPRIEDRLPIDFPPWAYTVGFVHTYGQPEVCVFGLPPDLAPTLLWDIARALAAEFRFELHTIYEDLLPRLPFACSFSEVHPDWNDVLLLAAVEFYEGVDFPAIQCIWPDSAGRFPWDEDAEDAFLELQPYLRLAPSDHPYLT
jgi:hypothetical protein